MFNQMNELMKLEKLDKMLFTKKKCIVIMMISMEFLVIKLKDLLNEQSVRIK